MSMSESDRLAREATAGEWTADVCDGYTNVEAEHFTVCADVANEDAAFIAYHSPAYILALNERVRLLEAVAVADDPRLPVGAYANPAEFEAWKQAWRVRRDARAALDAKTDEPHLGAAGNGDKS